MEDLQLGFLAFWQDTAVAWARLLDLGLDHGSGFVFGMGAVAVTED